MRFGDTDTQKLLRETARSFLSSKFPHTRLYEIERGRDAITKGDMNSFAELGWLGLTVSEADGGAGASLLDAAVVLDEFGYAAAPSPMSASIVAAQVLDGLAIARGHLDHLTNGQATFTVSEATRLRSPAGFGVSASWKPLNLEGGRLQGTLPLVPFAGISDFVLAPLNADGVSSFGIVPLAGAKLEAVKTLDRPSYAHVHFEGSPSDGTLVLTSGAADAAAMHERVDALTTALTVMEMVGAMQRVLEMSSIYIANRVQFGQPVAKFQAARHRAAEMLMQTESARWAAYHAVWRLSQDPADTREVWMVKHWANRAGPRLFEIAHLLHGGIGVGVDYPLHLYTQWLQAAAVRAGTQVEMTNRIVDDAVPAGGNLTAATH